MVQGEVSGTERLFLVWQRQLSKEIKEDFHADKTARAKALRWKGGINKHSTCYRTGDKW